MLKIETSKGNRVNAMVWDTPMNGISGSCQCEDCDAYVVLKEVDEKKIAIEILQFADEHNCGRDFFRSKEELLNAMLEQQRKEGKLGKG